MSLESHSSHALRSYGGSYDRNAKISRLKTSKRIIAVTGAGLSAASGSLSFLQATISGDYLTLLIIQASQRSEAKAVTGENEARNSFIFCKEPFRCMAILPLPT